jgi:hypothetical protein
MRQIRPRLARNGEEAAAIHGEACSGSPAPYRGEDEDALTRAIDTPGRSALPVQTCRERRVAAAGGIPGRKDEKASPLAVEKLHAGKERQAKNGHEESQIAEREDMDVGQNILLKVHEDTKGSLTPDIPQVTRV